MEAIVLAPRGLFFDGVHAKEDEFLVKLNADLLIRFRRVASNSKCFEAVEVLSASSQDQHPPSSVQGVWWSRQAALAADRDIASYRAGEGQTR